MENIPGRTRPKQETSKQTIPSKELPLKITIDFGKDRVIDKAAPSDYISRDKLEEAIIWSEILGKPLCKRRKRNDFNI